MFYYCLIKNLTIPTLIKTVSRKKRVQLVLSDLISISALVPVHAYVSPTYNMITKIEFAP